MDISKAFSKYVELLAPVLAHADRREPFTDYCTGLLLEGKRKRMEPMAARLEPCAVSAKHQSLHHFVSRADWSDEAMLSAVRQAVLPVLCKREPVRAWIVDDTGFPKQGQHSVGVARQYCGQLGKQDNCQVAVSVSVASTAASLPIAYQLYLPEEWAADRARRTKAGVPDTVGFVTKPQMAVAMIRKAVEDQVPVGVVLADAGYGNDSKCREALTEMGLIYAVGVQHSMTVRSPGHGPLAAQAVRRWGDGTASHIAATRPGATADNLETTGHAAAGAGLQDHLLAGRRGRMAHFALCPNPRSLGPSRLLAQQTSPGAMAAH